MLRTRILAAATATLLALGFAVGGASPAMAGHIPGLNQPDDWETSTGEVCYDAGFETENSASEPFVLGTNTEGYVFSKVIVKVGSTGHGDVTNENQVYTTDSAGGALTTGDAFVHTEKNSISHVIVCEVPAPPGEATAGIDLTDPRCDLGELLDEEGFVADNASYVVVDDGSSDGTFEVVFTADDGYEFSDGETTQTFTGSLGGPLEGEICEEEPGLASAGVDLTDPRCDLGELLDEEGFVADNASYVVVDDGSSDGTFEVVFTADDGYEFSDGETTQTFTGSLGGPLEGEICEEEPGLASAGVDLTDPNCFFGELLDEEGFVADNASYVVVDDGSSDGTFEVVFTADDGYEFSDGETTQTFTGSLGGPLEGEICVLPITDAFLAFAEATCVDPEALDEESFDYDSELAELTSVDVDGLDYTVVFTAIGENTQFFQSSEEVEGRTVSEGGTVLTFTGTLDGPSAELCPEVVEVVIPDPIIVDDCVTQSYTILAAEGVSWTRSVDGGEPVAVEFGDGQESITFDAFAFQSIVITASADEGYTMPEQYGPFEYTFAFDEECLPTAPVTTASVSWTQPDCLGNPGSYRLTNEPGVIWTVDGVVVAGNTTYSAPAGSTPSIVASLESASEEFPTGFGWSDPGQQTLWNLAFVAAAGCDLTTLALTGASNALGGLGIAAIVLIMAGMGLVLARRRDEARIES